MRLASATVHGREIFGCVLGDEIVDLSDDYADQRALLSAAMSAASGQC